MSSFYRNKPNLTLTVFMPKLKRVKTIQKKASCKVL